MNKKKIFKKIISIFLAFILLSCALVPIAAKAETVSDANFTRYFPFAGYYKLSGYAYYNSSAMSRLADCQYPENNEFGSVDISELVTNQYYLNFVSSLDDYVSLEDSFDMYVDIWSFDSGNFYVKPCIILVKKGSTICMKNPHQDGYVRVYNHQIYSDSPYIFACPINQAQNTNTCFAFWQKGSYGQNTVGTTTINGVEYSRLSLYVNKDHPFLFTNIPYFKDEDAIANYLGSGDSSGALNANKGYAPAREGCDSFYFDDFDCSLTRLGDDAQFYASYNYDSCNKIKYSPEDYQLALYFTINAKYKERNSIYNELSASTDWLYYDLHPNHLKSIKIIGSEINFHVPFDGKYYPLLVFDQVVGVINKLRGGNSDGSVEVISCYIYLTAGLVKKGSNAGPSSQNFFYSWDFETLTKRDLTPDLNVITDGDGTDKKVTQIVGNDGSSTIINISVNVQGGDGGDGGSGGDGGDGGSGGDGGDGGSGGDGGDGGTSGGGGNVTAPDAGTEKDTQSKSFWSILKSFVKFLASLIDDNDGLFPVIAAYFTFIPSEFWTCIIAVIVVIAVISIYKLLKK